MILDKTMRETTALANIRFHSNPGETMEIPWLRYSLILNQNLPDVTMDILL